MMGLLARASALGIAIIGLTGAGARPAPDHMDLGRGPNGELCAAERDWSNPAAPAMFDGAYRLNCRGWTETASAGALTRTKDGTHARAALARARELDFACGPAKPLDVVGLGRVEARQCRGEGNQPVVALTLARGGKLIAGDAIKQFSGNLVAGLRALADRRTTGTAAPAPFDERALPALPASAPAAVLARSSNDLGARNLDLRKLAVVGDYGDADELARPALTGTPGSAEDSALVDLYLEGSLARANLNDDVGARTQLDRARALIAASPALASDSRLKARLAVYDGLRALTRRDAAAAEAAADSLDALGNAEGSHATAGSLLNDARVVGALNQSTSSRRRTITREESSWLNGQFLEAQASAIRGAALSLRQRDGDALIALRRAECTLAEVETGAAVPTSRDGGCAPGARGNVVRDTSNTRWLGSWIASQQALIAERAGDGTTALLRRKQAYERLAGSPTYENTPLLARRAAAYGAALARRGEEREAGAVYDRAFAILRALGPTAAAGIGDLEPHFATLAKAATGEGANAEAARARIFADAQYVTPSSSGRLAETMRRAFAQRDPATASRIKALGTMVRERRSIETRLAAMVDTKASAYAALDADRRVHLAQEAKLRAELGSNAAYQKVSDTETTLAEVQGTLAPGEGYYKLLTLREASYGLLATRGALHVFAIETTQTKLTDSVHALRRTIDGNIGSDGKVYPRLYGVRRAYDLHQMLFAPVEAEMAGLKSLVIEPSEALSELPVGVLVVDEASTKWWDAHARLDRNDYTGVHFLAETIDVSTSISPRAFVIARRQAAARWSKAYIGFGEHQVPDAAALPLIPARLASTCPARAAYLEAAFRDTPPISADQLGTAAKALGGGPVVTGPAFTDTAIEARGDAEHGDLKDFAVLHFATHGLKEGELGCDNEPALLTSFDATAPGSSALLTYTKIARLDLPNTNLVVLAACNTASRVGARGAAGAQEQVTVGEAETLNGLVRAFLQAGSRAVLTTHWAIPVTFETRAGMIYPSRDFIGEFFGRGASAPIASAIRTAQTMLAQRVPTSHPYYWGAFAVVGDGARVMTERGQ